MPKILLDFSNVDLGLNNDFEPIPAGVYEAVIDGKGIETRLSQAGNETLNIPFVIVDDENYAGRRVFENFVLTESAAWKIGQLLVATGLYDAERDGTKFVVDTDKLPSQLDQKRVRIRVKIEEYDGRRRNRITRIAPSQVENSAQVTPLRKINF